MKHSYSIVNETVVEDNHRLYEIIVAEPVNERVEYTELELKYGPILLAATRIIVLQNGIA